MPGRRGRAVDECLFGGLGTTGPTRGAATFLRAANPDLETIGVVSTREDFIPGIRSEAERRPGLPDRAPARLGEHAR